MALPFMNSQADEILSKLDTFLISCKDTLSDKDFPLEDRWQLYLKIEKLLPINKYLTGSLRVLTDRPYDDGFVDGRGFRFNSEIDETVVENGEFVLEQKVAAIEADTDFVPDPWDASNLERYEKRDAWREAVLAEGTSGCAFDW